MNRLGMMIEEMESMLHSKMTSGMEKLNTDEFAKATDSLKDLYMCWYYKTVTESMQTGDMQYAMEEAGLVKPNARM